MGVLPRRQRAWPIYRDARQTFIGGLRQADYDALRTYISEQKIPPGSLSVEEMQRLLGELRGKDKYL